MEMRTSVAVRPHSSRKGWGTETSRGAPFSRCDRTKSFSEKSTAGSTEENRATRDRLTARNPASVCVRFPAIPSSSSGVKHWDLMRKRSLSTSAMETVSSDDRALPARRSPDGAMQPSAAPTGASLPSWVDLVTVRRQLAEQFRLKAQGLINRISIRIVNGGHDCPDLRRIPFARQ